MVDNILLGRLSNENNFAPGEKILLSKHSFDCGWYWGFGYIGNNNCHFHIDSLIKNETDINKIFSEPVFTQKEWWIIRDLFIQAYALKECAEVYRHGGHQTTHIGLTDCIKSKTMEDKLNNDLKIVLDKVWTFMTRNRIDIAETKERIRKLDEKIKLQTALKDNESKKLDELHENLAKEQSKIN